MNLDQSIRKIAQKARKAAQKLAHAAPAAKNLFLTEVATLLQERQDEIMAANAKDIENAEKAGLDAPRLDRLRLTPKILQEMQTGCRELAAMPEPVGAMETQWERPNGLLVGKMRIPLGVIAMIYEARPNVTVDSAALCVKAGNAVILRGGKEAINSNRALAAVLQTGLRLADLPEDSVQLLEILDHEAVTALSRMDEYIDVLIPRGGEKLIRSVMESATVPVLKHYKGVCHAYVDDGADLSQACEIVKNSKTQRPGVCNALECLLAHEAIAKEFLPMLARELAPFQVEFRADAQALPLLGQNARPLQDADKGMEFHAPILAVITVPDMDAAIAYISEYSSHHTDIICSQNYNNCMRFIAEVDASLVAVNASTRFNDGGQLGLGAEIGISTSKLHAYGPMGLKELTATKFVALGNGQIRE